MRKLLVTFFLLASATFAQTEGDLAAMLNKALDEVEASRAVIKVKDEQIALQEKLLLQKDELIRAYRAEAEAKQRVIDVLSAIKCNETQFRPLGFTIFRRKVCY